MSIFDELTRIFKTLASLQSTLTAMMGRFDSLDDGNSRTLDAIAAQEELIKKILDRQDQHENILHQILRAVTPPPAVSVIFTIKVGQSVTEGATKVKIKDNQEFDVSLAFQDAAGNPAEVQGAPTWTVDNQTVLSITPSADGLSATISAAGPTGTAQVSVEANADLSGDGQSNLIHGTLAVEVVAGDATLVVLNPGPARDKATPTPAPTPTPTPGPTPTPPDQPNPPAPPAGP